MPCLPAGLAMDEPACAGCATTCLCWRPASDLRPSPPLQPRRQQNLRLEPQVTPSTRRRYNSGAFALELYPPVSLPGSLTAFAANYPGQFSHGPSFGLAPSAAASGRASNGRPACAGFPSSARTGDQLQLSSRAATSSPAIQLAACAERHTLVAAPTSQPLACACCCILRQSWRSVPGFRLAASSPACAGCLQSAYFRSLNPPAESWLVFRLAPDPSSLTPLSSDPESRRMLVHWACAA